MNKALKYSLLIVLIAITLYNSASIKLLDKAKKNESDLAFNAKSYASDFMLKQVTALPAISASDFLINISNNREKYCAEKGKKLGISDAYNFIIQGEAVIASIEDEYSIVTLENKEKINIATDFIFGNAIRDGSAMADIGDYQNTMDFNTISVELNTIVRDKIIPPFREKAKIGDTISFKGAIKIDVKKLDTQNLKVIPISIKFTN